MLRPGQLEAIRRGEVDLAFRRWDRPRVKLGSWLRTAVGLLERLQASLHELGLAFRGD